MILQINNFHLVHRVAVVTPESIRLFKIITVSPCVGGWYLPWKIADEVSSNEFPTRFGSQNEFRSIGPSSKSHAKPERTVAAKRLERENPSKRISRCYHVFVITRFIYIGSRGKAKGETINGLQVKRVKCDLVVSIR